MSRTIVHDAHISHPEAEQLELFGVLHALSDPVRLEIVRTLADWATRFRAAGSRCRSPKSTLTHHLKVLREAGLTRTRTAGVQRFVSLRRDDIESRFPGLLVCVLSHAGPGDGAGF